MNFREIKTRESNRVLATRPLSRRRDRGFTAIEISMVATVIAILALIVMPIFRNRVEEAKIAAAQADLTSLMKAEILAKADTSFYFRLEDLDNLENNAPNPVPPNGINLETPPFVYALQPAPNRRVLTETEWRNLAGSPSNPKWKGPYITFQRHITYGEIQDTLGTNQTLFYTVRSATGDVYAPIWDLPSSTGPLYDSRDNRHPVDPWGSPYLFFPATGETTYVSSTIFSLGPDGLPGLLAGSSPNDYRPIDPNGLGAGDDLKVQF